MNVSLSVSAKARNPLRSWLAEFLLMRDLYQGPSGLPLYTYHVTAEEYEELRSMLTKYCDYAFDYRYEHSWAACFCLYVAECFRREYDAGDGGWAWSTFEHRLNCNFTPQQRAALVTVGLEGYWGRPIRLRERGRDLLGSLFAEGGLPWLLVQSESHGFGRSIRRGLKDYYRARQGGRTTADLISDVEQYLPQSFRNLETLQLLAGIVEQLMDLADRYPLREQNDPAAYLDTVYPRWRDGFPIPLDEKNAQRLINEWLKDAGRRRQEREEEEEKASFFTCVHLLQGDLPNWWIQTDVIIPRKEVIPIGDHRLNSTRMEVHFYEGEQLLAKGGVVYGKVEEYSLSVRFPTTQVRLRRRAPQEPLTLRLFENGVLFHVFDFAHSVLDYTDLPLVFEQVDDDWQFVATASCSVASSRVRIRLPAQFNIANDGGFETLVMEKDGNWLDATESLQIQDEQNLITIKVNEMSGLAFRPELKGDCALYRSLPTTVYLGWPSLVWPNEDDRPDVMLTAHANGVAVEPAHMRTVAGRIQYSLRNAEGETILQRRFGLLPKEFQLNLRPAMSDRPAKLQIQPSTLRVTVDDSNLHSQTYIEDGDVHVHLQPVSTEIPATVTVAIQSQECDVPVLLHLPFPYHGARLVGGDGAPLATNELALDELLGLQITLTSGLTYNERFTIYMELVGHMQQRIGRSYFVEVGSIPLQISLFSYHNDMSQMLGAVNEQDAYIRLTVETQKPLLTLNIRRYNGQVRWQQDTRFEIVSNCLTEFRYGVKASAMLLSDPRQAPVSVNERKSEGVGIGVFETNPKMERDAPWLIYPEEDSAVKFRPVIYAPHQDELFDGAETGDSRRKIHSLHEAARIYHPKDQPHVIDDQIAAMSTDFTHSGWQFLADLKANYAHLPLSTFEGWRALARNPEALSSAVFRLEIDEVFCERIRDELAVIWECTSLPLWSSTYRRFREWLARQGFPEVLQDRVLQNRRTVLPAVVSGFDHVGDYLETGDLGQLQKVPVEFVLPDWYQSLRRTHEANDNWPVELNDVLSNWIKKQNLPLPVKTLSQIRYSDSVTYLPIFMAHVTAGKTTLDELGRDTAYLKFAVKMISDFDHITWYACVHAMMVSYLLARANQDEE